MVAWLGSKISGNVRYMPHLQFESNPTKFKILRICVTNDLRGCAHLNFDITFQEVENNYHTMAKKTNSPFILFYYSKLFSGQWSRQNLCIYGYFCRIHWICSQRLFKKRCCFSLCMGKKWMNKQRHRCKKKKKKRILVMVFWPSINL